MKLFKTAGLAMAVSMIGLSIVSDVAAYPVEGYIYTYYTDATHNTDVGTKWLACNGTHGQSGSVTAYFEKEVIECRNGSNGGGL